MKTLCRFLCLLLLLLPSLPGAQATPANPASTASTRGLLEFIAGLEHREGKRVLSGQFVGYANLGGAHLPEAIFKETGHWPALLGVDYADYDLKALSYERQNAVVLGHWKKGGLVTISAHLYNPCRTHGDYGLRDKDVDLNALLKEGTSEHARWIKELDVIAAGLQQLKDAGVVVLWRPFHEMNGAWFWWGGKEPEALIRLWRHMFTYFSQEKHLDNLLWVYAPNHGAKTVEYYPGDAYVDIVGVDSYTNHVDPDHVGGALALSGMSKPFAFTEFGPGSLAKASKSFDYTQFAEGMARYFPRSCFFLCWDEKWSPVANLKAKAFYNHPMMMHLDDIQGLTGAIK